MEKAKIRPLATPKPLNRSSQKLAGVITSWMTRGMQNFVAIGSGVSAPQIRDFAAPFDMTSFYVRFLGSSIKLQPTPLNGFLLKIRKMTSFWVRKCLLGVPMTLYFIFRPLNFRKIAILGTDFHWTLFFCGRKAATRRIGRIGLVVTRLPAAREDPGSNRAADKSLWFHENHCDTQLWARAAH